MMDTTKSFNLTGVLKRVLYFNEENNYTIAVLENGQKICGQYFDTDLDNLVGEEILLKGDWITHKKYGVQFEFTTLEIKEAELYFFLTKIVKGVSKKLATELTKKYTDEELVEILDNTPAKLLEFKGIKEKKLISIVTSWNKFKHLRELGSFLAQYGVTGTLINKIYAEFSEVENLVEKIKENPYMLIRIKGVGFKRADEIAVNLGIDPRSEFRISACINYTLKEYFEANGNSSISKEKLFSLLDQGLNFYNENDLYQHSINEMLVSNDIFETKKDRLTSSMLYHAETRIVEFFENRAKVKNKQITSEFAKYIAKKEESIGIKLSDEQKKAVEYVNNGEKTVLLVGYAGTGKSTSSRAILELLEERYQYDDIICIALSGIAAQRISDTTGYTSSTIQSLLVTNKEKDYFPQKVVLLDEASMVNSVTFYQIISKIDEDTVFIIVGDDGQLPAIGAGNILEDSLNFDLAPVSKLTKIYRQDENQAIAVIANEIRKGNVPEYKEKYDDFSFVNVSIDNYYATKNSVSGNELGTIRAQNTGRILNKIVQLASTYIKEMNHLLKEKEIGKYLTLFQIITPMKNGTLGVENLNMELQKLFNSSRRKAHQSKKYQYKQGDKVIHTKNENMKIKTMKMYKEGHDDKFEKRVFNGMLGIIIKLDLEERECLVLYPNDDMVVYYDFDQLDSHLSLAYALTIHKTQGMEYESALIPMTFSHYIMHNTKLLYTAITRAKKMCFIVGEEEALMSGCKKLETTKRESVIQDLMNI